MSYPSYPSGVRPWAAADTPTPENGPTSAAAAPGMMIRGPQSAGRRLCITRGLHTRSADYVIVGAGTAGCSVARRLSDSGASVLCIEAGRQLSAADDAAMHSMVHDPMQYGDGLHTDVDWQYYSTKQSQLADRKIYLPRGRAVGGTGVLNGMQLHTHSAVACDLMGQFSQVPCGGRAFVKPPLADMDEWAAAGCDGWDGASRSSESWLAQPVPFYPCCDAFVPRGRYAAIPRFLRELRQLRDPGR